MRKRTKPISDAAAILYRRHFAGRPAMVKLLEDQEASAKVGRQIHDLRSKAKLTQTQLAKLVGTTASVISRLEDADYGGHSLSMLRRIAAALGKRVDIRFVAATPARKRRAA